VAVNHNMLMPIERLHSADDRYVSGIGRKNPAATRREQNAATRNGKWAFCRRTVSTSGIRYRGQTEYPTGVT
jgi:hypothetical protein